MWRSDPEEFPGVAMQLIPAIDLLDGHVVRLLHGDFSQCKVYDESPLELAGNYADAGAPWLHVVDLAASRDGENADYSALFSLLNGAAQSVQTGGGVRREADVLQRLEQGAERVVVGSLCVTDPSLFTRWLNEFGPGRLVAALDVLRDTDGIPWPRIHGWTETSHRDLWDLLDDLAGQGLEHVLCTDISRDGALSGPNLELYAEIIGRYPHIELQASGGVASLADLQQLKQAGANAAITGKALLEGRFSVAEALEALK